jgi:hypothetical protein
MIFTLLIDSFTHSHVEYPKGITPAVKYLEGEHPLGKYWDGTTLQYYRPLPELITNLKKQNAVKRLTVQALGISYEFPFNREGVVQTRDATDLNNISLVAMRGLILKSREDMSTVISFRDQADFNHDMNAEQAVTFGDYISKTLTAMYEKKWAIDQDIENLETVQDAAKFDINLAWDTE